MNRQSGQKDQGAVSLLLETATTLAGIGTFRWDLATDEMRISDRARTLLGLAGDRTPTTQQVIDTVVHPDQRDRAQEVRDYSLSTGTAVPASEWLVLDPEQNVRWVALHMAPATFAGSRATEMVGSLQDVTARHDWVREREIYLAAFTALAEGSRDVEAALIAGIEAGGGQPLRPQMEETVRAVAAQMGSMPRRVRIVSGDSPLTPRETEVLQMASHGGSSAAIAGKLVVSTSTVKTHFEHIYAKLGVADRAGAVAEALRRGLID